MYSAYASIDGLLDSFCRRCARENLPVACRKGCSWCCHQAVLASHHEILVIQQYLQDEVPTDVKEGMRDRALEKHKATRGMSAMEFLHYLHACPFLQDGSCAIYPARPMACRCYLSSSVKSCRDQYDNPTDRTRIAALYDFPLKAGRGMNEGIRSALMEAELQPSEWLLETFTVGVFNDEGITDEWLAGKTPFNIRCLTAEENRYLQRYYDNKASYGGR